MRARSEGAAGPGGARPGRFRVERTVALPPEEVWRRLTDWPAHGAQVPFTRTTVLTPGPDAVGTRFTARTGVGRFAFDDPMEVVVFEPPAPGRTGVCRLVKLGRAVRGEASFEVSGVAAAGTAAAGTAAAGGAAGSRVVWVEELSLRGVPALFDPVLALAGRVLFGRALDGLLRD
ncbi:SRPBCC family protein [Streptomyces showdoensis]|uniref:Immediate-early protein 2 n=1 Tax=Streptomyces showdoensis TaxID=68268 RepID=A0A2P2GUK6_STREW|nr:SRPBCC family protein [Streptomyces showdoensis]KKZ74549.1 Immediate-early protein 2 [Streptomyces showdoensis]